MLGDQKRALHIPTEQLLKVLLLRLLDSTDQTDARIIHQNVESVNFPKHSRNGMFVSNVTQLYSRVGELVRKRTGLLFIYIDNNDGSTSLGEHTTDGFSDAARASSDKRSSPVQAKRGSHVLFEQYDTTWERWTV